MCWCASRGAGIAFSLFLALGCGARTPERANGDSGDSDTGLYGRGPITVETFVVPLQSIAGEEVTVACVVSRGRDHLANVATEATVNPSAGPLTAGDTTVTFAPTTAGTYIVRCQTADGIAADHKGVEIEVAPAAPAATETFLSDHIAEAGAPVEAACDIYDAYGNLIDEEDYQRAPGLSVSDSLRLDPPSGPGFTVRGTLAGDWEVACTYGEIIDATGEALTIVPGIPGYTETIVDPSHLLPTQVGAVTCLVEDDYGNPLADVATAVVAMVADGSPAGAAGLTYDSASLSATKAGTYYVSCQVPGYFAGDETPAQVVIHPGLPHDWVVELPDQDCFWQDRGLPLLYIVYDEWANVVDPEDYDLTVWSTPAGVTYQNGIVSIPQEGDYTIWVSLSAATPQAPTSTISPFSSTVRVDSTPPVIDITSPARAVSLEQATATVAISGDVYDGISAIESVTINGNPITVTPGATTLGLSESQTSVWGLNVITGSAVDECGNRRVIAQSFLRSGQYFTAATSPISAARATSGLLARLNQPVIDDTNRNDVDDLATIAWMMLSGMDLDAIIPDPIADKWEWKCNDCFFYWDCADHGYRVEKNGTFTYSQPTIDWLYAVDGGIFLGLSISNLDLPLSAMGWYNAPCLGDYSGGGSGAVQASYVWVDATLSIALAGANPQVSICPSCIDIGFSNDLWIDIDWDLGDFLGDFLDSFLDEIVNLVLGLFQSQIEGLLEDTLRTQLPPVIEGFLSGFELAAGFDIPAPLGLHLNLASGLDYIDFDGPMGWGNGELGLYTQIFPDSRASQIPSGSPGTIRRRPAASDPVGPGTNFDSSQYTFGLGLEDDVLNQVLWGVWYGGGLELDLAEILALAGGYNLDGVTLQISAKLPPVIMPGSGSNQIYIGLGDAYVDATVNLSALLGVEDPNAPPLHVGMYLSTLLGGFLDLNPATNELLVALDPDPEIWVQVVQIDDEGYQAVMTDLFAGLMRALLPPMLESVIGSFPIPAFDLGGMGGLPPGTTLELLNGDLGRPNTANSCLSGAERMDATHFCLTGELQ